MLELTDKTTDTPSEINEKKFSSHSRLMRVTVWGFIINTRRINIRKGTLTFDEIEVSLRLWTMTTQGLF